MLKIDDVAGTRWLETTHAGKVKIPEENAAAALEIMSRFAVDPRWLVYLPPTMSPVATSKLDGFLEHPEQAFEEYAGWGVTRVVCEEKHMGSRAIAVIARDAEAAERRFGVGDGTHRRRSTPAPAGRSSPTPTELVDRLRTHGRAAVRVAGHRLARPGLRAAALVGQGARADQARSTRRWARLPARVLPEALTRAGAGGGRGLDVGRLVETIAAPARATPRRSATPTRRTSGPTDGLDGVTLAPFQILAARGPRARAHRVARVAPRRAGQARRASSSRPPGTGSSTCPLARSGTRRRSGGST